MNHVIPKSTAALLVLLPIIVVLWAGLAQAEDEATLSADELQTLIKGGTRAGKYPGGTYYLTFRADGSYCLRLNSKEANCAETGPWWFEGNTVCRKSVRNGEYCWNVTKLADNRFQQEITRVKRSHLKVGRKREFWME